MHYVYLLESLTDPAKRYIGVTSDLKARLVEHNAGKSTHTAKHAPWRIVTYIAFSELTSRSLRTLPEIRLRACLRPQAAVALTVTIPWWTDASQPGVLNA